MYVENNNATGYLMYVFQNGSLIEKGDCSLSLDGCTPRYIRTRAAQHDGIDNHAAYLLYGQLDDYWVDETKEFYLYSSGDVTTVLYYNNNAKKEIEVPNDGFEYRHLRYKDDTLYLVSSAEIKNNLMNFNVVKIDPEKNQSTTLHFSAPEWKSYMPMGPANTLRILTADDNLLDVYSVHDEKDEYKMVAFMMRPDGTYKEIPFEKPYGLVAFFYNTAEGFAMLEHSMDGSERKKEDFYMRVRYFDKDANELRSKEIDCTELQAKTKGLLNVEHAVAYHDGVLYIGVSADGRLYLCRYNEETEQLTIDQSVRGRWGCELELVEYRGGIACSLPDR